MIGKAGRSYKTINYPIQARYADIERHILAQLMKVDDKLLTMVFEETPSRFYKNCKIQRKRGAKICDSCIFRKSIETVEEIKASFVIQDNCNEILDILRKMLDLQCSDLVKK